MPKEEENAEAEIDFEIVDEQEKQKEEERLIEERRKRRKMILERYKSNESKAPQQSSIQDTNGQGNV